MAQEDYEGGSFADQIENELLSDVVSVDLPDHEPDPFMNTYGQDDIDLEGQEAAELAAVDTLDPEKQPEVNYTPYGIGVGEGSTRDLDSIKLIPGFELFKDAYKLAWSENKRLLETIQDVLSGDLHDDHLALLFMEQLERKATQNRIDATREWADQQGDITAAPVLDDGSTVISQSGSLDDPLGQLDVPMAPASRDTQVPDELTEGELAVLETEKTIRELQGDVTRLEQESIRDSDAVQNWSQVADYFNTVMANDGVEAGNEPLVVRVANYVEELREKAARLEGLEK